MVPAQVVNDAAKKSRLDSLIDAGLQWLDRNQHAEGFWVGMLESNCCMEAEWLLVAHLLGIELPDSAALIRGILARQRPDGAWETFLQAPSGDINSTVESYVALRALGMPPDAAAMQSAREWILGHGGLSAVRVFTRYWLALVGEWPWDATPNLPPEIIRLPTWTPFNIARFSSWARATLVPLCVLSALRFTRPLPAGRRLDELFPEGRGAFDYALPRRAAFWSWESLFGGLDRLLHFLQRRRLIPRRQAAIAQCLEWVIRHQDADGAWGGIQPPWVYSLVALHASGYALDHPVLAKGLSALEAHWSYWRGDCKFIQASESPVWDTLLTLLAMQDCGRQIGACAVMDQALDWVLTRECRQPGDWAVLSPQARPGGWAFQRANRNYPDVDDTAVAIMVLARLSGSQRSADVAAPLQRAIEWILDMQSDCGGWGAFDRNNSTRIITRIPFCDFGEVLDPPSADVTAHVVEALATAGLPAGHPALRRAVAYLWNEQEVAGCWFGRWGVNYIYGVAAVLPALAAAGEDMQQPRVVKAVDWLLAHQNQDGGWGETCASYMDLSLAGHGVSTASQTAWAMLALVAAGHDSSRQALIKAVDFLQQGQQQGTWNEPQYTGAGFPGYGFGARLETPPGVGNKPCMQGPELARAFMINYNLYRHYFPLLALGRVRNWLGAC